MAILQPPRRNAGYRGPERSGCDVAVYAKSGLSVSLADLVSQSAMGAGGPGVSTPSLVSCTTSNTIGSGGQFNIVFKAPRGFDPLRAFEADSWVDVSMRRGGRSWHVCRGLVDDLRASERAPSNDRTFTLLGRSFQKVFQDTPVYFNNLAGDNLGGAFLLEALGTEAVIGPPDVNVRAVLIEFLRYIGRVGRANWQMPPGLPGARGSFSDTVVFDNSLYDNVALARFAVVAQTNFPEVDLWALANQFADLQFCELFTELMPAGGYAEYAFDPDMARGLSPADSKMTVLFRDRVYPRVSPDTLGPVGGASPWFQLPTHRFSRQDITSIDRGWSSQEAFNSFTSVGALTQERIGDVSETQFPLWWPADMRRRGLRRMDASSMYEADTASLTTDIALANAQRSRLRDWYCLGAEMQSGSVSLARGAPEVKVGSRLVIEATDQEDALTFYIESVTHQWAPGGLKTSLAVTRGYPGGDNDHLGRLATVAGQFVEGDDTAAPDLGDLDLEPIR